MSHHQDLIRTYNQINVNMATLLSTNRTIINRIINTHNNTPQLSEVIILQLIDIYKQNLQQCTDYNIQINAILGNILRQSAIDPVLEATPMHAHAHVPAPVPVPPGPVLTQIPQIGNVPINVTTTFYRRGADGRDIPITAEEYVRLSAGSDRSRGEGGERQPAGQITNPMAMLDLLMAAAREIGNSDDEPAGATEAQIARETRTVQYHTIENPCSTTCAITHEEFAPDSEVSIINHCGHIFMHNSLDEWLKRDSRCPMCRHDICERNTNNTAANALTSAMGLNLGDNITLRHFTLPRRQGGAGN